jgi:hypothetical protein
MSSAQLSRGRGHWDREQPTVGLRRSPRSAAATPAEHHPASDGSAGLAPTPVVVATTARALPVAAAVRVALPHVVVPSEHAPNGLPHDASSEAWCSRRLRHGAATPPPLPRSSAPGPRSMGDPDSARQQRWFIGRLRTSSSARPISGSGRALPAVRHEPCAGRHQQLDRPR